MNVESYPVDFRIAALNSRAGAEISGLDLRRPIPSACIAQLEAALYEHLVLVFRDQSLDEWQQLAFCRQFGELYLVPNRNLPGGAYKPEMRLVSNLEEHRGAVTQLHDAEMSFHHDRIFMEVPQKALCMHAMEIPTHGGDTLYANMYQAYEALPADVKASIAGKTALSVYAYTQIERPDISKGYEQYEHARHPIVIRHPVTGRAALYVNRLMTMRVDGISDAEGQELLEYLFDHAEREEFYYTHVWRAGDVVLWDNLASMHGRTDVPKDQRRLLRHTSISGLCAPAAA